VVFTASVRIVCQGDGTNVFVADAALVFGCVSDEELPSAQAVSSSALQRV